MQKFLLDLLCPEQPKISCQSKVEVVENIQERKSERMGKQSRVVGVPKISCQENVEVFVGVMCEEMMKSFDAGREMAIQCLERFRDRFERKLATAVGEGSLLLQRCAVDSKSDQHW